MKNRIEVARSVSLVPVVEVRPYSFSKRPMPDLPGGSEGSPAVWSAYFQECMRDAGFAGVDPVAPSSSFVPLAALVGNPAFERIVLRSLGDKRVVAGGGAAEPASIAIDDVPALYGGLALIGDGVRLFEPQCCGDLENLGDWRAALADAPAAGSIWAGHPPLAVSFAGDLVTLAVEWEVPPPGPLTEVALPVAWLAAAFEEATAVVEQCRRRALPMIGRLCGEGIIAEDLSKALFGVPG